MGLASIGGLLKGHRRLAAILGLLALGVRFSPRRNFRFHSKSVVITGGSRGLGLALAEASIAQGALVTLLARDQEELQRAKEQLEKKFGVNVLTLVCDITNRKELKSAFSEVLKFHGRIDVLVNNAGSIIVGPFETMSQRDFEEQMNLHFYAVLKSSQLILPTFERQGEGRIVNISSIGGLVPVPHLIPYCASKFALAGFSESLALEFQKKNIHILTVYPGLMRTGSPVKALFKGDHEKEYAWFASSDSTPGISVPPQQAAHEIIQAVERGQTKLVISAPAKLGAWVYSNFPEIFKFSLGLMDRLLPVGTSQERRTGAESQAWLEKQVWAKPQRESLASSQKRFNESESPELPIKVSERDR